MILLRVVYFMIYYINLQGTVCGQYKKDTIDWLVLR